jgi:hypothetical protein
MNTLFYKNIKKGKAINESGIGDKRGKVWYDRKYANILKHPFALSFFDFRCLLTNYSL